MLNAHGETPLEEVRKQILLKARRELLERGFPEGLSLNEYGGIMEMLGGVSAEADLPSFANAPPHVMKFVAERLAEWDWIFSHKAKGGA